MDIALVTCQKPELYALNLAKQVYYFTGNGYVPVSLNPLVLIQSVLKTINQMWQIYWQIHQHKLSPMPKTISTSLNPLVSIIICTSDRPIFLEKALQSIALINYQNFEVIIIDASSTMETSEIVSKALQNTALSSVFSRLNLKILVIPVIWESN